MFAIYYDKCSITFAYIAINLATARRTNWYSCITDTIYSINNSPLFLIQWFNEQDMNKEFILVNYYINNTLLTIDQAHQKYPEYFI